MIKGTGQRLVPKDLISWIKNLKAEKVAHKLYSRGFEIAYGINYLIKGQWICSKKDLLPNALENILGGITDIYKSSFQIIPHFQIINLLSGTQLINPFVTVTYTGSGYKLDFIGLGIDSSQQPTVEVDSVTETMENIVLTLETAVEI